MADEHSTPEDIAPEPARPRSGWEFTLMMLTVGLLGALGAQSFLGTLYAWWAERTIPGWQQVGYPGYVEAMNAIAAPLVVLLVVVMGLCVPKRLVSRRLLAWVSGGMLVAGAAAAAATGSLASGLSVYLVLAGLIQVAVVVLTLGGVSGLAYLTEGRLVRIGSGLLHLGFLGFAFVVVALQDSPAMLPVFWVATVLLTGGSALAFYAKRPVADKVETPVTAPEEGP